MQEADEGTSAAPQLGSGESTDGMVVEKHGVLNEKNAEQEGSCSKTEFPKSAVKESDAGGNYDEDAASHFFFLYIV